MYTNICKVTPPKSFNPKGLTLRVGGEVWNPLLDLGDVFRLIKQAKPRDFFSLLPKQYRGRLGERRAVTVEGAFGWVQTPESVALHYWVREWLIPQFIRYGITDSDWKWLSYKLPEGLAKLYTNLNPYVNVRAKPPTKVSPSEKVTVTVKEIEEAQEKAPPPPAVSDLPVEEEEPNEGWRTATRNLLNRFCQTTGADRSKVWRECYREFENRTRISIQGHKTQPLDLIEQGGYGLYLFQLCKEMTQRNLTEYAERFGLEPVTAQGV